MQRRRFTLEFKQQLVQKAKEVGNASQVARRHGINPKVLYRWINESEHMDRQHTDPSAKAVKAYVPSPQEFHLLKVRINN